ncbi:MAG: flippase-like domain-containing protein [Duncaniella sp.]|nr:flippase-like domain-containing protein [Duncaniella sp.]
MNRGGIVWKILVPVVIGLGVVLWLFHREFNPSVWDSIHFDGRVLWCIALAWLFMIGRELGLSWRFRCITDRELSWWQSVKVTMLCEFTSCITPTSAGGSALSMVFMNREGIELGRATSLMMTTLFLDELFFVISLPLVMSVVPYRQLFGFDNTFTLGLETAFWIVYVGICLWTLLLFLGIIVRPRAIHSGLNRLFRLKWLRRWASKADELGHNMEITGDGLRRRSTRWWTETFGATVLSWTSRFLVVNALFLGFVPMADQLVVLARQFVVWVVLTVSPTPGGAGISEWLFTTYYGDLIGSAGMALVIALFWRIISYYVYLAIGACIVPGWVMKLKK